MVGRGVVGLLLMPGDREPTGPSRAWPVLPGFPSIPTPSPGSQGVFRAVPELVGGEHGSRVPPFSPLHQLLLLLMTSGRDIISAGAFDMGT